MKKLSKKLATIAGIVMFAVIMAVGVTFVSVQKKESAFLAIYSQNMSVLAQGESGNYTTESCYFNLEPGSLSQNECDGNTSPTPWYGNPGEGEYKCNPKENTKLPGPFSSWGSCYKASN